VGARRQEKRGRGLGAETFKDSQWEKEPVKENLKKGFCTHGGRDKKKKTRQGNRKGKKETIRKRKTRLSSVRKEQRAR